MSCLWADTHKALTFSEHLQPGFKCRNGCLLQFGLANHYNDKLCARTKGEGQGEVTSTTAKWLAGPLGRSKSQKTREIQQLQDLA